MSRLPPPEKLLRARRALDEIPQVELINDWKHDGQSWFIQISINTGCSYQYIPEKTAWYIVVDPNYPCGRVKIYPSAQNGIVATFPHQANNAEIASNGLWRNGALCTDVIDSLYEKEPFSVDGRLAFHVKRACDWLYSAGEKKLILPGDRFELPDFSPVSPNTFVFSEDLVSYMQWEDSDATFGIANLYPLKFNSSVYYAHSFMTMEEKTVLHVSWGSDLESPLTKCCKALWLKLNSVPVMNAWQAPFQFGDLVQFCDKQNINILELIKSFAPRIRDGKTHFTLIGFPIPKYFGDEDHSIYWQAFELPVLSFGKNFMDGFRKDEKGYWMRDRLTLFAHDEKIRWVDSQNWNENEISERGKINEVLRRANIAIIGCGCIGASLAESFVRGGICNLTLIDQDIVSIGNLSRHTLSMDSIGKDKAQSLMEHLMKINPHTRIAAMTKKVELDQNDCPNVDLSKYSIVIDCTGNNIVLDVFSKTKFMKNSQIISLSIGIEAAHIYMSMQRGPMVYYRSFYELIMLHLAKDNEKAISMELPRDGIGCWHPTFPARHDDIVGVTSAAAKIIERFICEDSPATDLVLEKQEQNPLFFGYQIIERVQHVRPAISE